MNTQRWTGTLKKMIRATHNTLAAKLKCYTQIYTLHSFMLSHIEASVEEVTDQMNTQS